MKSPRASYEVKVQLTSNNDDVALSRGHHVLVVSSSHSARSVVFLDVSEAVLSFVVLDWLLSSFNRDVGLVRSESGIVVGR